MAPVTIPESTTIATRTGQNCWSNVLRSCGSIRVTKRRVCLMALGSIVGGSRVLLNPYFFTEVEGRQDKIPIGSLIGANDDRL